MSKQKNKLKVMLKKRNPLLGRREVVKPAKLYTKPQVVKTTSGQVDKRAKPQTVKATKPQVVKYTTHLKPETIKEVKRYALENELKDYKVIQEAVELYLKTKNTKGKEDKKND